MRQFVNKFKQKHMVWLVNSLVFMFFTTVLAIPKGYSYAPIALAIIGVIYLFFYIFIFKKKLNPAKEDKWLIFSLVFYFGTFALSAIIHSDGFREIDSPSRVLLFLPLLLLFRDFPINLKTILYGIPVGTAIAGSLSVYQKFYLNLAKPFPYLFHIQAGDIAISLAMMSLAISVYWGRKKNYKWMIFSLTASALGIIASALTGARGGWVGLPILLAIILRLSYKTLSKKSTISIASIVLIVFVSLISLPQTKVLHRIDTATKEVWNYFEKNHKHTSLGARFDMWQSALLGIKEKPVLGWGSKGYIELKKAQLEQKVIDRTTLQYNDPHNQYLDLFVKKGIIGLLALLSFLAIPMIIFQEYAHSNNIGLKTIAYIGILHSISICFFGMSQTFLAHNSGMLFYTFMTIVIYSSLKNIKT